MDEFSFVFFIGVVVLFGLFWALTKLTNNPGD